MSNIRQTKITSLVNKTLLKAPVSDNRWALPDTYVGVEIEVENYVRPDQYSAEGNDRAVALRNAGWAMKGDGSLVDGTEFVFNRPMMGQDLSRAIDGFFSADFQYSISGRTGTHIHVNWLDDSTLESIDKLVAIMYCIEPAVFELADPTRKWCGFCLQMTEMDHASLRSVLTTQSADVLTRELGAGSGGRSRYYATNLRALWKFGTVEFRHFPGVTTKVRLEEWINLCMLIKKASTEYPGTFSELCSQLSTREGIAAFMTEYFPTRNLGERMLELLDIDNAVTRMNNLIDAVEVTPAKISNVQASLSPAAQKIIANKFPAIEKGIKTQAKARSMLESLNSGRLTSEEYAAIYDELREMGVI